jgi:hypothetical protein
LALPFGSDQGQQAAIGRMMAEGRVLYRDIWDNRPPGVYLLAALGWKLGLSGMWGLRALDLVWQAATAGLLGLLALRLWGSRSAALLAAALYSLAYYGLGDFWNTCEPDGKLSLPLCLGLLLLGAGAPRRAPPSGSAVFLAGVLWGAAFVIKYPALALGVPLGTALLLPVPDWRSRIRGFVLLGLGGLVPNLLWGGYCLASGSLAAFYWDTLHYNSGYVAIGPYVNTFQTRASELVSLVLANREVAAPLLLLPIAGRARASFALPGAWLLAALAMLVAQDKYNAMHYYPSLAPLALFCAAALSGLAGRLRCPSVAPRQRLVWGLALALALVAGYRTALTWSRFARAAAAAAVSEQARERLWRAHRIEPDFDMGDAMDLTSYLKAHRVEGERLFVWGFGPGIYYLADAPMATRFASHLPLVAPFAWKGFRSQFYADLKKERPRWIAVLTQVAVPSLYGSDLPSAELVALHPPLLELLDAGELVLRTRTMDLYRIPAP